MDLDDKEVVSEEEIDDLGIKKKDDDHLDDTIVDGVTDDTVIDRLPEEEEESDESEKGIYGDDPEYEKVIFGDLYEER
jgi:hypothetical protein